MQWFSKWKMELISHFNVQKRKPTNFSCLHRHLLVLTHRSNIKKKGRISRLASARKGLKPSDLTDITSIKNAFKWNNEPRPFQLDAIKAQLLRQDVLIHAGTGSGKTAVAAGPHAHEKAKGMVTFMISPLIALQDEQIKIYPYSMY